MEYIIIVFVMWCNAILRVSLEFNKSKKMECSYGYIQPVIFPFFMLCGALLAVVHIIDIVSYIVMIGLLFEFSTFIYKRANVKEGMKKYTFSENENKLTIYFDKGSEKQMVEIMELLTNDIDDSGRPKYFIIIEGCEVTIDAFLGSCVSNNYHLYHNDKHNMFIKYLPTLYLLSEDWKDVVVFCDFIGSFNEGQMTLTFLKSEASFSPVNEGDKSIMFENIKKHSIIEICVYSDGYELEISSGSSRYKFATLIQWLSEQNYKPM